MEQGTPTGKLRFKKKDDGRTMLQQEIALPVFFDPKDYDHALNQNGWPTEWRDVPLVDEFGQVVEQ